MTFSSRVAVLAVIMFFGYGVHAGEGSLNIGMIPDAGATQVSVQEKAPLKAYLTKAMGREVNLVIPTSYNATIEALGNGSLDFAYLGGLSYLRAHKQYDVVPLVQRSVDLQFHSVFITPANSPVHSLKDLKGKRFAYGDINSTSGHLIPFLEMRQAGLDPDKDIQFRYSGSHPATAKAVESGAVDAGALDETVYNTLVADGKLDKNKVRVFHNSKPFVDYVWVARKDMSLADRERFIQAFTSLKEGPDSQVLQILRGKDFVRANNEAYTVLRLIAQQLKML
ncbi:MAG TPA: phosphate/phosphite/phosphonate ABC transporter substrate-binding protein [Candidatus Angelobacter sp.]|nr:phosphate/phosphite/phosphonate ABC transporter substrate-binding protein [Candidatus Angelobacter sp.]